MVSPTARKKCNSLSYKWFGFFFQGEELVGNWGLQSQAPCGTDENLKGEQDPSTISTSCLFSMVSKV